MEELVRRWVPSLTSRDARLARSEDKGAGPHRALLIRKMRQTTASATTPRRLDYGDFYKLGIIDPTKVVRTALQDAASVAATEAMVAEKDQISGALSVVLVPSSGGMRLSDHAARSMV